MKKVFSRLMVILILTFSITSAFTENYITDSELNNVNLCISKTLIEIGNKGKSEFIDVIAKLQDGSQINVNYDDVENPTNTDLLNAYQLMQTGDGCVWDQGGGANGHCFIISTNWPGDINDGGAYVYEQTPYLAICSYWTYAQMLNYKFRPFRNHSFHLLH